MPTRTSKTVGRTGADTAITAIGLAVAISIMAIVAVVIWKLL